MCRAFDIAVIGVVLLVQLAIVIPSASSGYILGGISYRRQERSAAMDAMMTNRTPETVAAFKEETRMAMRYYDHRQFARSGVIFAILLVLDGVGIYLFRHYGKRKAA
jgi:uncharacterized membrane protein YozB (DUF420 family)